MSKKLNINTVNEFWEWFSANCQNFGQSFDNAYLINELDVWVQRLGGFTWEIGPGKTMENALTISPNGNLELLPYTKEIISMAPKCNGWEYYFAKQPKQWEMIFDFETESGNTIEIDASRWEYVLLKYEDGLYGVIIKFIQSDQLSDNDKIMAAEIALDGVLGEGKRIQFIDELEFVEEFEDRYNGKASRFKNIALHFNQLLQS
ncbi:hypothetical protein DCC81_21330 [Chitinophaga parva]|uniref:Uncharacterized protein n=1 Tax=Chitinophaga parva TaxID=2169414 RepID=A0A2T7BD60_9BACT|nr:hypothetical protein [Chitinophaga parva]PUZ22960.1 hypothetical protein DCC81_21330 [Chitinophaga parva]